jgi:hypothetical protein
MTNEAFQAIRDLSLDAQARCREIHALVVCATRAVEAGDNDMAIRLNDVAERLAIEAANIGEKLELAGYAARTQTEQ